MNKIDSFVLAYRHKMLRKFFWSCWIFLIVAIIVHNTFYDNHHEFHLGTFLFGMSITMFAVYYIMWKHIPKAFDKMVFTIQIINNDVVKFENKDNGVVIEMPKDKYLSDVRFEKDGLQIVSSGSFVCLAGDSCHKPNEHD